MQAGACIKKGCRSASGVMSEGALYVRQGRSLHAGVSDEKLMCCVHHVLTVLRTNPEEFSPLDVSSTLRCGRTGMSLRRDAAIKT